MKNFWKTSHDIEILEMQNARTPTSESVRPTFLRMRKDRQNSDLDRNLHGADQGVAGQKLSPFWRDLYLCTIP